MYKIEITKVGETWTATFGIEHKVRVFEDLDSVEDESFTGLMVKVGDKKWIDKINKNP